MGLNNLLKGYNNPDGVAVYIIECEQNRRDQEIRKQAIKNYEGLSERLTCKRNELDRVKLYNTRLASFQYKYSENNSYPWWVESAIEAEKLYYVGSSEGRAADRIETHIKKSNSSAQFFEYFDVKDIAKVELIQTGYPQYVRRLREWETAASLRTFNTVENGSVSKIDRWICDYMRENLQKYIRFENDMKPIEGSIENVLFYTLLMPRKRTLNDYICEYAESRLFLQDIFDEIHPFANRLLDEEYNGEISYYDVRGYTHTLSKEIESEYMKKQIKVPSREGFETFAYFS